jgi:hypothetical protein
LGSPQQADRRAQFQIKLSLSLSLWLSLSLFRGPPLRSGPRRRPPRGGWKQRGWGLLGGWKLRGWGILKTQVERLRHPSRWTASFRVRD